MPVNDELGKRMKEFYEQIPKTRLMRRTPVAIRIDGKAFHTFTRGFERPFDQKFQMAMQLTMEHLCANIQGCIFGYQQSDEITLILIDYNTFTTEAWFNYEVQKMCSVAASMATMRFNKVFKQLVDEEPATQANFAHRLAAEAGAMFDARVFNIPKEEVTNLIFWRQLDAERNSVQACGQNHYPPNQLRGISCKDIKLMLKSEYGFDWNNLPSWKKHGAACRKVKIPVVKDGVQTGEVSTWKVDLNMPRLIGEDRAYVDDLIKIGEE